jgi:hypothetical protein
LHHWKYLHLSPNRIGLEGCFCTLFTVQYTNIYNT